jgi:hypothetical protein
MHDSDGLLKVVRELRSKILLETKGQLIWSSKAEPISAEERLDGG